MPFFNTEQQFSPITKTLHWLTFLLFSLQFFLIFYPRETLPKDAPERLQYLLLHKSVGLSLLLIAIFMVIWRHLGKKPRWPTKMPLHERILARLVHLGLYLVMLLMPISGYLMSVYAGYSVSVFGWFELPNFFPKNLDTATLLKHTHTWISYAILGLVALHLVGALKHHLIDKNNLLKRMLPFG